jgi:hypothetical protein
MTSKRSGLAVALAVAVVTTVALGGTAFAGDLISEASKTGALAGAMKYCRENHAADGKEERKYKRVSRDALKKMDEMSSDEKKRALLASKSAADKGEYMGRALDQKRCEKVRKTAGLSSLGDKE